MKTAVAWIEHCNEFHSICAKYRCQEGWHTLPSRVIDVGVPDSLSEPYLFVPNGQRAPYVCLSHCWGSTASTLIKTTKGNLEALKKQIPLAVLPRTFADAVRITRATNIRYLWIDSLCIVQDNTDDWQNEAAAMTSIYKNAYLTIAATASKDSSGGCFRPRRPFSLLRRPQRKPTQPSRPSETLLLYPNSIHTIYDILEAPLHTRGWAFQELILSCRTLNFCEDQLLWHCLERTATEDGVTDFPGYNKDHKSTDLFFSKLGTKIGLIRDITDIDSQRIYW